MIWIQVQIQGIKKILLTIDDGYWYYDTVDGSFYYDETADQNMEDAVKIAEVTNDGNALTKDDLSSTDILYNSDTVQSFKSTYHSKQLQPNPKHYKQ